MSTGHHFIENSKKMFNSIKMQAERSMEQVSTEDLHYFPDDDTNSIAIMVKHISGNMVSRWTDIFTTDGEKSNRNRPSEFDLKYRPNRDKMISKWDEGWEILFATLDSLKEEDVLSTIYIRKEPHTVLEAIQRQLAHYSVHIGQITFMAKLLLKDNWKTLSIPRDKVILDYKNIDTIDFNAQEDK